MNNKRFFTFGCSYTHWEYPTWADLIGVNYNEFFNFGKPGACNTYIMNQFIEAESMYDFDSQTDFVMVALTGFGRFSYLDISKYSDGRDTEYGWVTSGDILFNENTGKQEKCILFAKKLFNFPWAIYNSWIAATTIKKILSIKKIPHKIIMSIDNSHFINSNIMEEYKYLLKDKGNIIDKANEIYNILDCKTTIDEYRVENRGEGRLYPLDNGGVHPSKQIYYDYIKKFFPDLLSENSEKLLNTPNEEWRRWHNEFDSRKYHSKEKLLYKKFNKTHT